MGESLRGELMVKDIDLGFQTIGVHTAWVSQSILPPILICLLKLKNNNTYHIRLCGLNRMSVWTERTQHYGMFGIHYWLHIGLWEVFRFDFFMCYLMGSSQQPGKAFGQGTWCYVASLDFYVQKSVVINPSYSACKKDLCSTVCTHMYIDTCTYTPWTHLSFICI